MLANNYKPILFTLFIVCTPANAFMEHFFHQQQQQQQHHQEPSYQDRVFGKDCNQYLCPDTLQCVRTPSECPCPFPDSQIKCVLPTVEKGGENTYVCISKGSKNCKYVLDAHKGLL